jgi:hypothetical protein
MLTIKVQLLRENGAIVLEDVFNAQVGVRQRLTIPVVDQPETTWRFWGYDLTPVITHVLREPPDEDRSGEPPRSV